MGVIHLSCTFVSFLNRLLASISNFSYGATFLFLCSCLENSLWHITKNAQGSSENV